MVSLKNNASVWRSDMKIFTKIRVHREAASNRLLRGLILKSCQFHVVSN